MASRTPSSRCGIRRAASSSRHTTRLRRPSASGLAMRWFTGVTRWIHSELRRGVRTGTGTMIRRRRPRHSAITRMRSRYDRTSGPPMSSVRPAVAGVASERTRYSSTFPHRDRLALGLHPPRCDHHRQPFDQVAQDLERRRPGPDDHRRPKHRDRHPRRRERVLDLAARREVLAEARARLPEAAKVDDPLDAARRGRSGECPGQLPVNAGIGRPRREHRVNQVERRAGAGHRAFERDLGTGVAGDDLDGRMACPPPARELARLAGKAADGIAGVEQARHEAPADVAGRARHEDGSPIGRRHVGGGFLQLRLHRQRARSYSAARLG